MIRRARAGTPLLFAFAAAATPLVLPARQEVPGSAPALPAVERCEECHTGAAREVAAGSHASVSGRCTACHGGDPEAADERAAHRRKFRAVPLAACDACHESEAQAFKRGPHGVAFETQSMRGCVECHGVHDVPRPGPALLRTACERCHSPEAPEAIAAGPEAVEARRLVLEAGRATASALEAFDAAHARAAGLLDRAADRAMVVRDARERLEAARLALLALRPDQHAMDLDPFRLEADRLRAEADASAAGAEALLGTAASRRRYAWLVGALVAANAVAIFLRRRALRARRTVP